MFMPDIFNETLSRIIKVEVKNENDAVSKKLYRREKIVLDVCRNAWNFL